MLTLGNVCFLLCLQIQYNFQWLQAPIQLKKYAATDKSLKVQPLACMNVSDSQHPLRLF